MKIFSQYLRSALLLAALTNGAVGALYCQEDSCMPTAAEWATFSANVGGKLIAIDPPLKPCVDSKADDVCVDLFSNCTDASWVSTQPGGYAYPVFTQDAASKLCFLHDMAEFDAFRDSGKCEQGAISSYGVAVTSEADIAAALAFAASKNLQVVVKNSGLDPQGRSVASKYALMIWLNDFKGIETRDNFKACASDAESVPAVIARGGARWGDVYKAVKAANYHVVGDSSPSVGAVGGWLQGGGHSFSSPAYGLGVDNVLKFTVVLADGRIVDASPCTNPDLFWALRGGGGGTYGVVTSVAYRLYPKQTVTGFKFDFTPQNDQGRVDLLTALLTWVADVSTKTNDVVVGGYPVLSGSSLGGNLAGRLVINGTLAQAQTLLAPLQAKLDALVTQNAISQTTSNVVEKDSFLEWHEELEVESVGTLANSVSRLIPTSLCAQPEKLVKVLTDYAATYPLFVGKLKLVTGGAVSTADKDSSATSVTPSWRDSCVHLVVSDLAQATVTIVPTNIFASTQADVVAKNQAVSTMGAALRDVAGASRGAYFGESDYTESDWKAVFWGKTNYDKLLATKKKFDPKATFNCHHCVGEGEDFTITPAPPAVTPAPPTTDTTTESPTTVTPSPSTTTAPATTTTESPTTTPASTTAEPTATTMATTPTTTTTDTTVVPTTVVNTTAVPTTVVNNTGVTNTTAAETTTAPTPTPAPTPDVSAKTSGGVSVFAAGGFSFPILFLTQVVLLGSWFFFRNQ